MVETPDISNQKQLEEIQKLIAGSTIELQNTIKRLSQDIAKLNTNIATLESANTKLQERVEFLERRNRKNNIIIFGFPHDNLRTEELAKAVIVELKTLLSLELKTSDINNTYYIGNHNKPKRPVIVQLSTYITKSRILRNVAKLKGKGISISNDLSPSERKVNKVLVDHLKQAKSKKLVAFIRGDKLHIGEEIYSYQQLIEKRDNVERCIDAEGIEDEVFIPRFSTSAPGTPTKGTKYNLESSTTKHQDDAATSAGSPCSTVYPPPESTSQPGQQNVVNDLIRKTDSVSSRKGNANAGAAADPITKVRTISTPTTPALISTRSKSTRIQGQLKK